VPLRRSQLTEPCGLRRALELIHDRFFEPLTLSLVAEEVGIHPCNLARAFRRHYRSSLAGIRPPAPGRARLPGSCGDTCPVVRD